MGFRELARSHNQLVDDHENLKRHHNTVAAGFADLSQEHRETRMVLAQVIGAHNLFVQGGFFQRLRWLFRGLNDNQQHQRSGPPVEVGPGKEEEPSEGRPETHGETGA